MGEKFMRETINLYVSRSFTDCQSNGRWNLILPSVTLMSVRRFILGELIGYDMYNVWILGSTGDREN